MYRFYVNRPDVVHPYLNDRADEIAMLISDNPEAIMYGIYSDGYVSINRFSVVKEAANDAIKDKDIIETDFFSVYEKVNSHYRAKFTEDIYSILKMKEKRN